MPTPIKRQQKKEKEQKNKDEKAPEAIIAEAIGKDVLPLVKVLKNKKNVSEFVLAKAIGEEINVIRNMLYRLYDVNLVSFTRKKDKKKGWYVYYWTFQPKAIGFVLEDLKKKRLTLLREQLHRERENHFYVCESRCVRLNFEQAMDYEFKCLECGSLMNQEDNTEKIRKIEEEIKRLEGEA